MSFHLRNPLLVLAGICLVAATQSQEPPTASDESVSGSSRMTVQDASTAQLTRLGEAFAAFRDAELELPDLHIRFFADDETCGAEHGRFYTSEETWHIRLCPTKVDSVYEHELAHAWERAQVTDTQRRAFMRMRGYASWSDRDLPWNERGIEGAASVIERGVAGLPLPPVLGKEEVSRLKAYELLTGRTAPVLVEWLETRDVPCERRPTLISRSLPDESGLVCGHLALSVRRTFR